MTHTNLGGQTLDEPEGGCYGWYCITTVNMVWNADSISMLGIALFLWRSGYQLNDRGNIIIPEGEGDSDSDSDFDRRRNIANIPRQLSRL